MIQSVRNENDEKLIRARGAIKARFLLIYILILSPVLRLYRLDKSLWFDELGEYYAATQSFAGMLGVVKSHLSPPLDYTIMWLTLKVLPHQAIFIRLPSVLFGVGSVYLIYLLAGRLFSKDVAIISAFLLAISPFAVQYSQEARMYSSFLFLTLLSFYLFARIQESDRAFYAWIAANTLLIYDHYFAVFVFVVQAAYVFVINAPELRYQATAKAYGGIFLAAASFIPWLPVFLYQTHNGTMVLWYGLGAEWQNFFYNPLFLFSGLPHSIIAAVFVIGLLAAGLLSGGGLESKLLLVIWLLFPLIMLYSITASWGSVTTEKNFIFVLPAFVMLMAAGVVEAGAVVPKLNSKIYMWE